MNLNLEQKTLWSGRPVLWSLALEYVCFLAIFVPLGPALWWGIQELTDSSSGFATGVVTIVLVGSIALALVFAFIEWCRTRCYLTADQVITRGGLLFVSHRAMRIRDISRTSVARRFAGTGYLTFHSTGGEEVSFGRILDVDVLLSLIHFESKD